MRVRLFVTLPKELLKEVDAWAGRNLSRSAVVKMALYDYVAKQRRKLLNTRDIEIINANADRLNKETRETFEIISDSEAYIEG